MVIKPHIVIDARLYGTKHTGIGRYVKNLLFSLTRLSGFRQYRWTLIICPDQYLEIESDLGNNFDYRLVNIKHYTFKEQILLPVYLYLLRPNLVHFTHFNKPLLYFGKSVVTIHDLIKHFSYGAATTTKPSWQYWPKYLVYRMLLFIIIKTNTIIVPSNFWRKFIISRYRLSPKRITTTYEALDPYFKADPAKIIARPKPYLIYTGNLYPHKNINIILAALKNLPHISLKIICSRSVFSQRIKYLIKKFRLQKQVKFLGYIADKDFSKIYAPALALVHPSFYEGFSLTGLEAMALNCPVISSNSSCLPEIYGNSVLYFNPNSVNELVAQINKLYLSPKLRLKLIKRGKKLLRCYSWTDTALKTFKIYKNTLLY